MSKALLGAVLLFAAAPARAQNPSMSADFERMMGWLADEVIQGLAFNAGSTFDPPNELRPWRMQPDISLGIGMLPLDKKRFPTIQTPSLAEKDPGNNLPSSMSIPNLALHLRVGLPSRMDFSVRGANMTVPKGYKLSPTTKGNGQSNSIGFGMRKHFMGDGENPLVSVGANFNHVKGYFNFVNEYSALELTPGFVVDSVNTGRLEWNVNSLGVNTVVSKTYGIWTPFAGFGMNRMSGSVKARLQADFATPLIAPSIGEASSKPEETSGRVIFGTQMDRSRFSFFVNGEIKALGVNSGRTMIVQTGIVAPFRIGASSLAAKAPKERKADRRLVLKREPESVPARPSRVEEPEGVEPMPWEDEDAAPRKAEKPTPVRARRPDDEPVLPARAAFSPPPAERAAPAQEYPISDYREAYRKRPKATETEQPELIFIR